MATLLLLPLASASAAPQGLASPAQAEDALFSQLWQWLAGLLGAEAAGDGEEANAAFTCSAALKRGCAIDPNGSPSN